MMSEWLDIDQVYEITKDVTAVRMNPVVLKWFIQRQADR